MIRRSRFSIRGISLIETCIFLVVVGLFLSGGIYAYRVWRTYDKVDIAKNTVKDVQAALDAYYMAHGKYPCPARRNVLPDDPNWGKALDVCYNLPGAPALYTVNAAGTWAAAGSQQASSIAISNPRSVQLGRGTGPADVTTDMPATLNGVTYRGDTVAIGALPVRTLGLPDDAYLDSYGHQFVYAVSERYTHNVLVKNDPVGDGVVGTHGAINLTNGQLAMAATGSAAAQDSLGQMDNANTIGGGALYTVVQPAPSGAGAWNLNGKLPTPCPAGGDLKANCDDGGSFRNSTQIVASVQDAAGNVATRGPTPPPVAFATGASPCDSPTGIRVNGQCGIEDTVITPAAKALPNDGRCALSQAGDTQLTLRQRCNLGAVPADQSGTVDDGVMRNGAKRANGSSVWKWTCLGQCQGSDSTTCTRTACEPTPARCGPAANTEPAANPPSGDPNLYYQADPLRKNSRPNSVPPANPMDVAGSISQKWQWRTQGKCYGGVFGVSDTYPGTFNTATCPSPATPTVAGSGELPVTSCSKPWCGTVAGVCGGAAGKPYGATPTGAGAFPDLCGAQGYNSNGTVFTPVVSGNASSGWSWTCAGDCQGTGGGQGTTGGGYAAGQNCRNFSQCLTSVPVTCKSPALKCGDADGGAFGSMADVNSANGCQAGATIVGLAEAAGKITWKCRDPENHDSAQCSAVSAPPVWWAAYGVPYWLVKTSIGEDPGSGIPADIASHGGGTPYALTCQMELNRSGVKPGAHQWFTGGRGLQCKLCHEIFSGTNLYSGGGGVHYYSNPGTDFCPDNWSDPTYSDPNTFPGDVAEGTLERRWGGGYQMIPGTPGRYCPLGCDAAGPKPSWADNSYQKPPYNMPANPLPLGKTGTFAGCYSKTAGPGALETVTYPGKPGCVSAGSNQVVRKICCGRPGCAGVPASFFTQDYPAYPYGCY